MTASKYEYTAEFKEEAVCLVNHTPLRQIPAQSGKRAGPLLGRTAPLLDLGSAHEDARSLATLARLVGLNPYFIRDSIGVRMTCFRGGS